MILYKIMILIFEKSISINLILSISFIFIILKLPKMSNRNNWLKPTDPAP